MNERFRRYRPSPRKKAVPGQVKYKLRIKVLEKQQKELRGALVASLNHLLDLRDMSTGNHSTRLAEWGLRIARDMGFPESSMSDLKMGALLHDIGKIGIPDSILKKPGPLTTEERELVKRHAEFGWTALRNLPGFRTASLYVLHHHENYDGTGYPAQLKGAEIPIGARIVSVIDAFDAMVSCRPYRAGLPFDEAVRRLQECRGSQFDPAVVDSFVRVAQTEAPNVLSKEGAA
jgi:HD-GYP domain-containing protein (c-di-GMP phosphodiesterase class II)